MAINKTYKRQVKRDYKSGQAKGAFSKRRVTWSFKIGDLVEVPSRSRDNEDDVIGVIVKSNDDGNFLIISPDGRRWVHAKKMNRLQKSSEILPVKRVENNH